MTRCSTYFTSIDQPNMTETRMVMSNSKAGRDGTASDGGTNSHTFVEDGETSYMVPHPTWDCLVCTNDTPVADMLAHSPPFPLVIDIDYRHFISERMKEGMILALKQYGRVRRVRLRVYDLEGFLMAIDEEYPVLEYLILQFTEDPEDNEGMPLMLPESLQAPHLRHLLLRGFSLPIGSRLLTTAVGLVTLALVTTIPSSYFEPNSLLQCLSFVPQLEKFLIVISYPVLDSDVERHLMHAPITTSVTLTNLLCFDFQGANAYVEAVIRHITASRLERIRIRFFEQPSFSVPSLLQIINTTENLTGFECAHFKFSGDLVHVSLGMYYPMEYDPRPEVAKMYTIPSKVTIIVDCWSFDEQVSSVVQILNSPGQIYSTVEHLGLEYEMSSGVQYEADHTEWRKLLRSFSNVKTLRVNDGLAKVLSRCLRLDDGELPLLPELQELLYYGRRGDTADALTSFIDSRRDTSRPVALSFPRSVTTP